MLAAIDLVQLDHPHHLYLSNSAQSHLFVTQSSHVEELIASKFWQPNGKELSFRPRDITLYGHRVVYVVLHPIF